MKQIANYSSMFCSIIEQYNNIIFLLHGLRMEVNLSLTNRLLSEIKPGQEKTCYLSL